MTQTDWIALAALLVSLSSLLVAWYARRGSVADRRRSQQAVTEQAKLDLLAVLAESRAILNRSRMDIGALKAEFDAANPFVRGLMVNHTSLFTEYLPIIETALEAVDGDRKALRASGDRVSVRDLLRRTSECENDLKNYENAAEQAARLIEKFRGVFAQAKLLDDRSRFTL